MAFLSPQAEAFDHNHTLWTAVLQRYVTREGVQYAILKNSLAHGTESQFGDYLHQLEAVRPEEYESFSKNQKMAFLINAYNAMTIKLIVDHYPVKSIKDTGGFFKKPWSIEFFSLLGGKIHALDPIEHDYLRPLFKDYRIHAAVNCASKSCPELRHEAFVADVLHAQLDDQMAKWLADKTRNKVDSSAKIIRLSKIFDWYEKDFETWGGGLPAVLSKHAEQIYGPSLKAGFKIKYLDYDWTINERT